MAHTPFVPKPGQIDYTNVRWAPVINCVLMHKGKILIVKRSKDLELYPGYWNGIGGFLDDKKSLEEKVREELYEELGIKKQGIISLRLGEIFDAEAPEYQKTFVVHPVFIEVKTSAISLDWEAEEYAWVTVSETKQYKLTPSFIKVLAILFPEHKGNS